MGANLNFVRSQGFETSIAECEYQYPALIWQPRIIAVLTVLGVLLESGWYFIALAALMGWNVLLPRLNPFDAIYDHFKLKRIGHAAIGPAPAPRRFSQALAGAFMLGIGIALLMNMAGLAWALQIILLVFISLLIFGRFCAASYLWYHLVGKRKFANKNLPWASGE